jgi:hypothetical protein
MAALWVLLAAAGLYGLHRLALWCEACGWIYYVKRKASPNALGTAFLEIQQLADPSKKYVIEAKQRTRPVEDEAGSGDSPAATDADSRKP